jgi:prepilin-type N-terminal cleavage/methylation domain-containing protein
MTPTTPARRRAGFTLVELLVVMGVIIILSSIALLVVPSVISQDRTTDAAGRLQQWLRLAQLRAARDGLPRGVRLLDNTGTGLVTECQYVETPDAVKKNFRIAINYATQTENGQSVPLQEDLGGQHGIFLISEPPATPTLPSAPPPADEDKAGFVSPRIVQRGAYIPVPEIDLALRIQQALPANRNYPGYASSGAAPDTFAVPPNINQLLRNNEKVVWKLVLATVPGITTTTLPGGPDGFNLSGPFSSQLSDPSVPTSAKWNTKAPAGSPFAPANLKLGYSAGSGPTTSGNYPDLGTGVQTGTPETAGGVKLIEGPFLVFPPPDPLLGEPVLQLAADTVIDLKLSKNGANVDLTPGPVDLVFNPTGELVTLSGLAPGGQVFLWVRNRKGTGSTASMADFETSGEQQLVGIKSLTGGLGVYPVAWEPGSSGNPYKFAQIPGQ